MPAPRTIALIIAGGLSAALCAYLVAEASRGAIVVDGRSHFVLGDDAMISLRYASNLVNGNGLVWNTGEYVQGITNLGWTLVMAIPLALGVPPALAPLVIKAINAILHAVLAWGVFAWSWRRARPVQGTIAAVLVAFDGSIAAWGMSGFETTLQALLMTRALLLLLDDGRADRALLWAAAAVVVRPDAVLIVAVALLVFGLRVRERGWTRPATASLIMCGGVLALLFVGQRLYYGEWLPNTYALKATRGAAELGRGLEYLWRFAWVESFALVPLCAPVLNLAGRLPLGRRISPPVVLVAAVPYLWVAYVVIIGGDAFPYGRFFIPILPLLALFAGALVEDVVRAVRNSSGRWTLRAGLVLAGAMLVVAISVQVGRSLPVVRAASGPLYVAVGDVCLAVALGRAALPADAVIGVYYAGTMPYFLPLTRFHDFLGKSDRHIARARARPGPPGHNKWDYAYSLGQIRPDLIVTAVPFTDADDAQYRRVVDRVDFGFHPALWLDPIFRERYRSQRIIPPTGATPGKWPPHWVYARAGFEPRPIVLPEGVCKQGPW